MAETYASLNELAAALQRLAEEKGFRDNLVDPTGQDAVSVYVANFHGEASELWEAVRCDRMHKPCDKAEKMASLGISPMTCLEEELADMIIRPLDTGNIFGVDIDAVVASDNVQACIREMRLPSSAPVNTNNIEGVVAHDIVRDMARIVNAYHRVADNAEFAPKRAMGHWIGMLLGIAFHICRYFGLEPLDLVMRKHAYNKTRPFRHGGKLV